MCVLTCGSTLSFRVRELPGLRDQREQCFGRAGSSASSCPRNALLCLSSFRSPLFLTILMIPCNSSQNIVRDSERKNAHTTKKAQSCLHRRSSETMKWCFRWWNMRTDIFISRFRLLHVLDTTVVNKECHKPVLYDNINYADCSLTAEKTEKMSTFTTVCK